MRYLRGAQIHSRVDFTPMSITTSKETKHPAIESGHRPILRRKLSDLERLSVRQHKMLFLECFRKAFSVLHRLSWFLTLCKRHRNSFPFQFKDQPIQRGHSKNLLAFW